jgi:hypothetical protein
VRIRTYCFPGCFTRPPGTSTRDHPHVTTASKPVVPVGACVTHCNAGRDWVAEKRRVRLRERGSESEGSDESVVECRVVECPEARENEKGAPPKGARGRRAGNKSDAVPGRLRNPTKIDPKAFLHRWRGLTPLWPRSLRLGSASGFNLRPRSCFCKPSCNVLPAPSGKKTRGPHRRRRHRARDTLQDVEPRAPVHARTHTRGCPIRERLAALPQ